MSQKKQILYILHKEIGLCTYINKKCHKNMTNAPKGIILA